MPPIRVKLYGLFALTKRRYLYQQAVAVGLTLVLLFVWYRMPGREAFAPAPGQESPRVPADLEWLFWLTDKIPWIVGVLLTAIAAETYVVLRIFARKEVEQQSITPPESPEK
jgi:hypothetical protein